MDRRTFIQVISGLVATTGLNLKPDEAASGEWSVALYDGDRCILPRKDIQEMPPEAWVGEARVFRPMWTCGEGKDCSSPYNVQGEDIRIAVYRGEKRVLDLHPTPAGREWMRQGITLQSSETFTIEAPVKVV